MSVDQLGMRGRGMVRWVVCYTVVCVLFSNLLGCATIGWGERVETSRTVVSTIEERRLSTSPEIAATLQGSKLMVNVTHQCDKYVVGTERVVWQRERVNMTPGTTIWTGVAGAVIGGLGAALLIDSGNVHDSDRSGRQYNQFGPDVSVTFGVSLGVVALAAFTGVIVDAVRAGGVTTEEESKEIVLSSAADACERVPVQGATLDVRLSNGSKVVMRPTDKDGAASASLRQELQEAINGMQAETRLVVSVELTHPKTDISQIELIAVPLATLEELYWPSVDLRKCENFQEYKDCHALEQYLALFPDGENAAAVRAVLSVSMLAIGKVNDDRAWAAAQTEACLEGFSGDCDEVTEYLRSYPAGLHVAKARRLLDAAKRREDANHRRYMNMAIHVSDERVSFDRHVLLDTGYVVEVGFTATVNKMRGYTHFHGAARCWKSKRRYYSESMSLIGIGSLDVGDSQQIEMMFFGLDPLGSPPDKCEITIMAGTILRGSVTVSTLCRMPNNELWDGRCPK